MQRPLIRSNRLSTANYPSGASIKVNRGGQNLVYGGCLRAEYYRKTGEPREGDINPDWEISARLGEKYQELLEELFDEYSIRMGLQKIAIEYPFYADETNLSGRTDMLYWDIAKQEIIGVEVKSVGDWKAGKTMLKPAEEHVMQAMLYLDWFRQKLEDNSQIPGWYIVYMARSESWNLKKREHGSPFTGIWDFFITLDSNDCPVIHGANTTETWEDFPLAEIVKRFDQSTEYFENKILPDRDYDLVYTEEKIASLYKLGMVPLKKDQTKIEKWLKNGAVPGDLDLEMGDFECKACPYQSKCWGTESLGSNKTLDLPPKCKKVEGDSHKFI